MEPSLRLLLRGDAVDVAPELLGWSFTTRLDGDVASVRLTEVEAYMGAEDPASHAHRGETRRTAPMFMAAGVVYVYLSYGMHHCVNIVTGPEGEGQAVLLRGGTPTAGIEVMQTRRGRATHLADGPGKLGQALGLTTDHSGLPIDGDLISLEPGPAPSRVVATARVGISRATDLAWRFLADDAPTR